MSYLVIARKWRPKTFSEVVGQDHITVTLQNAIAQNRIAHAYLFTGPRGIGKTTTARILAKALNCEKGPTEDPCNKCLSCTEITQGNNLDVLEIDGASNRGIEEVRNLRENVKFAPTKGKFKVYIIDEVHMLTPEAFNALLKTLEEPPAHVKFIFATTSPHKVPATILSRCQRFDFKRISINDLVKKLKEIAKSEKFTIDEDALFAVSRVAEGSLRDAESVLDQLASFCEKKITLKDVNSLLGSVEEDMLFEITQEMIDKDAGAALKLLDKLIEEGKDILQFIAGLLDHFRNILVAKLGKDHKNLIEMPQEYIDKAKKQGESLSVEDLIFGFSIFSKAQETIKKGISARLPLEMAIVKFSYKDKSVQINNILEKLDSLEESMPEMMPEVRPEKKPDVRPVIKEEPKTAEASDSKDELFLKISRLWKEIVEKVKEEKISCGSFLESGAPVRVSKNRLVVGFPKRLKFYKETLEAKNNLSIIEKAIKESAEQQLGIEFEILEDDALAQDAQERAQPKETKNSAIVDPIVKSALDAFKGNVVKIE